MSDEETSIPHFVCHVMEQLPEGTTEEIREIWRESCKELDFYGEYGGHRYCVLHFPSEDKEDAFNEELERKLAENNYNFDGTFFPASASNFEAHIFNGKVNFAGATFVKGANFTRAQFNGAQTSFRVATFNGEQTNFSSAQFNSEMTSFREVLFNSERKFFQGATFDGELSFLGAKFSGDVAPERGVTRFDGATFNSDAIFLDANFDDSWTDFSNITFRGGTTTFSNVAFNSRATNFDSARFGGEATSFHEAEFNYGVAFTGANFSSQDTSFLKAKFRGERTWFPGAIFSGKVSYSEAEFSSERTDFRRALFKGSSTGFATATFSGQTDYHDATLGNATFENATFKREVDFTRTEFTGTRKRTTDFRRSTFEGEVYFREAMFRGNGEFNGYIDFYRTNFLDAVKFIGDENKPQVFGPEVHVSFRRARTEKPELISFDTLRLRLSWFAGVDASRFQFSNVEWYGLPGGPRGTLEDEVRTLREQGFAAPYPALAKISENLAHMAENSGDYEAAGEFYYYSMDVRRKENWRTIGLTGYLYWALSGYGERPRRAFWILVAICVVFAVLYMVVGPSALHVSPSSGLSASVQHALQALVYSMGVMSRLGPNPEPGPGLFQFLVTVESIAGPVQIAVLLLAVRRKILRERIFP